MLITPHYRDLNAGLHQNAHFGAGGWKWVGPIQYYLWYLGAVPTVLDYGAGKGTLKRWMPPEIPVTNYDPVTFPDLPEPHGFVTCLDVLEHIEPACLDDVLAHIRSLAITGAFFVISTRDAKKVLPDGRNAHLIVQSAGWWQAKLEVLFKLVTPIEEIAGTGEAVFLVEC